MRTHIALVAAGIAVSVVTLSGCAVKAPPYSPSIQNVSTLKSHGAAAVAVGAFTVKSGLATGQTLSLRANTMTSAIGGDFAAYLGEAIRSELELAGRLGKGADIEVSGVLLRNDVDPAIGTGTARIDAQFVVRRGGAVRFDKVKRGEMSWDSSFAAAVAIPKATQNYPVTVQNLLAALYADADFQAAIR